MRRCAQARGLTSAPQSIAFRCRTFLPPIDLRHLSPFPLACLRGVPGQNARAGSSRFGCAPCSLGSSGLFACGSGTPRRSGNSCGRCGPLASGSAILRLGRASDASISRCCVWRWCRRCRLDRHRSLLLVAFVILSLFIRHVSLLPNALSAVRASIRFALRPSVRASRASDNLQLNHGAVGESYIRSRMLLGSRIDIPAIGRREIDRGRL